MRSSSRSESGLGRMRHAATTVVCTGVVVCSAGVVGVATTPAAALPSNCTGTEHITCTFAFLPFPQTWTVPAGVTSAHFQLFGGEGALGGGQGGMTRGTLSVTGGSVVTITVGGSGLVGGGYNGGGAGAARGGGASDVRVGGTTLADRVLVAGGGGGGALLSGASGGLGGGATGQDGATSSLLQPFAGGTGGTQTGGGRGGLASGGGFGSNGQFAILSSGGDGTGLGGGGGGGYFGGGGGGTFTFSFPPEDDAPPVLVQVVGAGGGGSGYFSPDTSLVTGGFTTLGGGTGNGEVTVTYDAPATTTTVESSKNPSTFENAVTLTATVSPSDGSGTVGFFADGSATAIDGCDAVPLSPVSSGYQATCTVSSLTGGNHPIHASYTGTPGYLASSGDLAGGQRVDKAPQTITFPALRNRSVVESPFSLVGVTGGDSGNAVTFGASGACTVTGKLVRLTHPGTCTITARQAGNGNYAPAPNRSRTFTVSPKPHLRIHDTRTAEGDSGSHTVLVEVTLDQPVSVPVTVDWTTANGSAAASSDYQSAQGGLTFAPGQTSRHATTTVRGDKVKESDEVFFVHISHPHNATITDSSARVDIVNDD